MFKLNKLKKLTKKPKRIGRGGSRGGTSGRGHKGQRARTSGNVRRGFEGGQMVLSRRLPRRGFNNVRFQVETGIVSLKTLEGVFDDGAQVTVEALIEKGVIKSNVERVKILGGHALEKRLVVIAHAFSESAQNAITKVGGKAQVIEG